MNELQLVENVDTQLANIRTKSLDVSFNEIYDMYSDSELIITPEYQRLFRWSDEKQSRFIESLLLEMPVPPIFVIEVDNGVYELIDGLQRISSYLHFRGVKIRKDIETSEPLSLVGCDIIDSLNGTMFDTLPKPLQIKLKRSFVRMEVIRKESEPGLKYHMFKRLNNGGELLSDQELRNCTIRLLNSEGINFISKCAKNKDFQEVTSTISDDKRKKQYAEEMVLRFFSLKNDIENYAYPLSDYLTEYLEKMTKNCQSFDFDKEQKIFEETFSVINKALGKEAYAIKAKSGKYKDEFKNQLYDAITIAVSEYCDTLVSVEDLSGLNTIFEDIKLNSDYLSSIKSGSLANTKSRILVFKKGVEQFLGIN